MLRLRTGYIDRLSLGGRRMIAPGIGSSLTYAEMIPNVIQSAEECA